MKTDVKPPRNRKRSAQQKADLKKKQFRVDVFYLYDRMLHGLDDNNAEEMIPVQAWVLRWLIDEAKKAPQPGDGGSAPKPSREKKWVERLLKEARRHGKNKKQAAAEIAKQTGLEEVGTVLDRLRRRNPKG